MLEEGQKVELEQRYIIEKNSTHAIKEAHMLKKEM